MPLFLSFELNMHVQSVCVSVSLPLQRLSSVCVDPELLHIRQDNDMRSCRVLTANGSSAHDLSCPLVTFIRWPHERQQDTMDKGREPTAAQN